MHCPVCGGATTCPAGDTIVAVRKNDILQIHSGHLVPPGYMVTHRRKRYSIAIPAAATVVGTAQSDRVVAHHLSLLRVWVGQCSYAFVSKDEEED